VAEARGIPPAQVALAWIAAQPGVVAPIVGVTRPGHLEDAVAALDVALTEAEVRALEAPYRPHRVLGLE
jgi:aryl-alcohol dehydrogenase (NADP+)